MTKRTFLATPIGSTEHPAAANQLRHHEPRLLMIALAAPFYAAEEYHQKYHVKHGGGTCRIP